MDNIDTTTTWTQPKLAEAGYAVQPDNNQKLMWVGLMVVLVVAAAGIGYYVMSGQSQSESETTTSTSQSNQTNAGTVISQPGTVTLSGSEDVTLTAAGNYRLTGKLQGASVIIAAAGQTTVTLDSVTIEAGDGPAIYVSSALSVLTIDVVGQNSLKDGQTYTDQDQNGAIYSLGEVIVDGQSGGSLTIAASQNGIRAEGKLTIETVNLTVTEAEEGLESKDVLTINGGNLNLTTNEDGLNAENGIVINGGSLTLKTGADGIDSNGYLTFTGGTVTLSAPNNANGAIDADGVVTVNGGTVFASGGNMGVSVSGQSSQYSIWIGATVKAGDVVRIGSVGEYTVGQAGSLAFYTSPSLVGNQSYVVSINGTTVGTATLTSKSVTVGTVSGMGR